MMFRRLFAWTLIGIAIGAAAQAGANQLLQELEESFIRIHDEVGPSVVNIETSGSADEGAGPMDDLFHFFGIPSPEGQRQMPRQRTSATGSGFIYDEAGYIITNNHVVESAESIVVRLQDGQEFDAEIVGTDPDTDIAVIKVESDEPLPAARLGDSDGIRVGQFAIAIGSPRRLEGSVSFGHISALGRENLEGLRVQGLRFQNLIQTDAAINLGNSGGPLCNSSGEVVGINTAIVYGANSIGFAIPINVARRIVPELISEGKVTRGFLGVGIDDAAPYADALSLPDTTGAFVKEIRPDTPAERADLQTYDVIRKVNGEPVDNASDLVRRISSYQPGSTVVLEVWRDQEAIEVDVELDEWNPGTAQATDDQIFGMRLRDLTPAMAERIGLDPDTEGVVITDIEAGSPAEEAELMHGDIITELAQQAVTSSADVERIAREAGEPGKSLLVRYIRGNNEPDITVIRIPR
jgi:serine protease Do